MFAANEKVKSLKADKRNIDLVSCRSNLKHFDFLTIRVIPPSYLRTTFVYKTYEPGHNKYKWKRNKFYLYLQKDHKGTLKQPKKSKSSVCPFRFVHQWRHAIYDPRRHVFLMRSSQNPWSPLPPKTFTLIKFWKKSLFSFSRCNASWTTQSTSWNCTKQSTWPSRDRWKRSRIDFTKSEIIVRYILDQRSAQIH